MQLVLAHKVVHQNNTVEEFIVEWPALYLDPITPDPVPYCTKFDSIPPYNSSKALYVLPYKSYGL